MGRKVEIGRTDVATYLGGIVGRIRSDAMSLRGLARRDLEPGRKDLDGLADSLELTASLLGVVKQHLCRSCRLLDVVEHVTFGTELEVVRKSKRKGARDEQKEGKGRKGRRRKG